MGNTSAARSCLWDRLRRLPVPTEVRGASREEKYAAIARRRIGPYQEAAARGGPFGESLREDAARRLRSWRFHIPGPPEPWRPWRREGSDQDTWVSDFWFLGGEMVLLLVAGALVVFTGELLALAIGGVMFVWWRIRVRDRLIRALRKRQCPDCGYDLRGLEAGLDPAQLGVDVGPQGCPECGAPWPLLPPGPRRPKRSGLRPAGSALPPAPRATPAPASPNSRAGA